QLFYSWGLSPVTSFGPEPVSAGWEGKVLAPSSEKFNLFIRAQGAFRLFLDHMLVMDGFEENLRATKERMVLVNLVKGNFHDNIAVGYKEEGGPASILMVWKSDSVPPSVVPASALYYATPAANSPFNVTNLPRGIGSPFTDAYKEELGQVAAEKGTNVTIQE
ncbi:unnamed protein product, partial [Laminaria digitata]